MKKNILITVLVLVVLILAGVTLYQSERLNAHKEYYKATEDLLDTLENHYNWVDAFDPQDYYDAVDRLN